MNRIEIIFIDLLYQPKGSFDDDFNTIAKSVEGNSIFHLRVQSKNEVGALAQTLACILKMSPRKVVFLSAKMWQLILLLPLAYFRPVYVIYHFRPNTRASVHDRVLPLLSKKYTFAAYSESVRKHLCTVIKRDVPLVASRLIDRYASFELLTRKLQQDQIHVFCPGIRHGVRLPLDYRALKRGIEGTLGRPISSMTVQDASDFGQMCDEVSAWVPSKLSDEEYSRLYNEALIISMRFCPEYEARSSAMINDALGRGCIVVTDAHPITIQYGYPMGLVTDLEHLPQVIANVCNGSLGPAQIPGFDNGEAKKSWMDFLKLGV